ncbi:MAG TPA: ABC transporter permease [Vicinamibacterales bacterium]|nr:ABC transporter permease [Vicinamibacterales bacterium]
MRPVAIIEPATLSTLRPIAALRRLPQFGDLLWTLATHRLKVRYKQSRLGIAWAVIQPLTMMAVFTLVFTMLGRMPGSSDVPYPLFAYAALVPWVAFSTGLSSAVGSLTGHASLLTKVYFPREILPMTYVFVALVDLGLASLALAGLMIWYEVPIAATAVWAITAVMLLAAFTMALSLLLSAVQVRHRDVSLAMPMVLQVWMFASPVIYPLSAVRKALPDWLYAVYLLNPMASVVDTFRSALVLRQGPDWQALGAGVLVTCVLLPCAYLYFKLCERTMADAV